MLKSLILIIISYFLTIETVCCATLDFKTKKCLNGANSMNTASGNSCICLPMYTGTLCENIMNFYASNPCLNGGTLNGDFRLCLHISKWK
jgi:hypothetical protein